MPPPSKPSIPLSKVPGINELCELLGFQHASVKETNLFMEAIRAWRKGYKTISGRSATMLLDWNVPTDQLELGETAHLFLRSGNGDKFWSPNRAWMREFDLQYPEDQAQ